MDGEALKRFAVIGVDNTLSSERQGLSSIIPNLNGMGTAIAEELHTLCSGQALTPGKVIRVSGARLMERESTQTVPVGDLLIQRILRSITRIIDTGDAPRIEVLSEQAQISRRTLLN
ncbi:hypothetical protein RZS08_42470, partial [Arthrospira platensis SPKY1]|nr:hypothetical protein [Arthrospira platensis SPKY1]